MKNKRKPNFVPAIMMISSKPIKMLAVAICSLIIISLADAQSVYPLNYFRSPVNFQIYLSGTFGELRAGHFHSGMDIKTGGVSGKNIYAVADGYVSRIKVSATGFGKTLYINHPNGFVSVYAHLDRFNDKIEPYVKSKHYHYESFELNIFPEPDELPVKKGEVIAYSGNTGGSDGPHLHFEMRLESTQTPVNPLLFGFDVKDHIRPSINWLKVYPAGESSLVDGKPEARVYEVKGWGEQHRIKNNDTIEVSGPFALGVNTWDRLNDAANKNGVYSIELFVDGSLYYSHDLEKFDYSETRYINSLIDYVEYVENTRRYQRTEIDPNNFLSIYDGVKNRGIILLETEGYHVLEYVIRDFAGNVSRLPITVKNNIIPERKMPESEIEGEYFSINRKNSFTAENLDIVLPGNALYRDMYFIYNSVAMPPGAYSRIHKIHNDRTPVHFYYSVGIVPDSIPPNTDKLYLARISDKGDFIPYGGDWKDGMLSVNLRSFGDYIVLIDTIPPRITSVNIASGIIKADRQTVQVRIIDKQSGIASYRASLNGEWLLMEYDAKNDLLIYYIDERLNKGKNDFELHVVDQRSNESFFRKTLIRQ